jgi:hypothetical protein
MHALFDLYVEYTIKLAYSIPAVILEWLKTVVDCSPCIFFSYIQSPREIKKNGNNRIAAITKYLIVFVF